MANVKATIKALAKRDDAIERAWQTREKISTNENGKVYSLELRPAMNSTVYQIDNVLIKEGNRCDKLVIVDDEENKTSAMVFVELKGKKIKHGISQLQDTFKHPLFNAQKNGSDVIRARIITPNCGPKSAARIDVEKVKGEFRKNYNCEFRILKSKQPDEIL